MGVCDQRQFLRLLNGVTLTGFTGQILALREPLSMREESVLKVLKPSHATGFSRSC